MPRMKTPRGVPQYSGSQADMAENARGAGLLGITPQQYERTGRDLVQDHLGQQRLNAAVAVRHAADAVIGHHSGKRRR